MFEPSDKTESWLEQETERLCWMLCLLRPKELLAVVADLCGGLMEKGSQWVKSFGRMRSAWWSLQNWLEKRIVAGGKSPKWDWLKRGIITQLCFTGRLMVEKARIPLGLLRMKEVWRSKGKEKWKRRFYHFSRNSMTQSCLPSPLLKILIGVLFLILRMRSWWPLFLWMKLEMWSLAVTGLSLLV